MIPGPATRASADFFKIIFHCAGSSLLQQVFSSAASGSYPLGAAASLALQWTPGRAGSVVVATGLVAPQHAESSWTRDQTCVPCIGRLILDL